MASWGVLHEFAIIQQYKLVTCSLLDERKPRAALKNKTNSPADGTSNLDNRAYFYTELLNPYRLVGAQETILATSDCELRKYLKFMPAAFLHHRQELLFYSMCLQIL